MNRGVVVRSAHQGILWWAAALGVGSLLAGCVFNDNGSTFTGSNIGRVVNFSGLARNPGELVTVQVLNPTVQNPKGTWVTLGTTHASNTPFDINGTNSYGWNLNVTPVPLAANDNRWKAGGLARFRALSGTNQALVTFDDTNCWLDSYNAGSSPLQIQIACQSHASPVLTFVDKDPSPAVADHLYLRSNTPAEAGTYNGHVNAPATLASWRSSRGFPNGEVVTRYYNRGDLGIGREMHCREQANAAAQNKPDVACYVSNYGSTDDGLADTNVALTQAINSDHPFATVAMDYWSGQLDKVRFYTYDNNGHLLESAKLDSHGAKPTPGICINCHGGTFSGVLGVAQANFLPFDLENLDFVKPAGGIAPPGPIYTKEGQQEEFRQLNLMVRHTNPAPAIVELVDGWYGGLAGLQTAGTHQDPSFVPPGWAGEEVTYLKAIAPYCRTCHVGLNTNAKPNLDFNAIGDINSSLAEAYACTSHGMPHAEVTQKLFWASNARAHLSGTFNWHSPCN